VGRIHRARPRCPIVKTLEWDGLPGHVCVWTAELRDLGDGRTKLVVTDVFHTTEERVGVLSVGAIEGLNETCAALDARSRSAADAAGSSTADPGG
jgi:hypothetical protein